MKPRIFIAMHYLEIGGAESSLIGLLHALDPARCDVDLFLYSHRGELLPLVPAWVRLLPEVPKYALLERPMTEALRAGCVDLVAARLLAKVRHRLHRLRHRAEGVDESLYQYVASCTAPLLPPIGDGTYDLAISFLTPHTIVRDKVRARRKAAWIHTDYSAVYVDARLERPVWGAYDRIASISAEVTAAFLKTFPALAPKIVEIENILSPAFVRARAAAGSVAAEMPKVPGRIDLLSVGRFCPAKNYDNVPAICRLLVERGLDVRWYLIGFGGAEALIRAKIAEAGMEERVVILGKKTNPYPYIAACDLYVQPSRFEGKSVTVREAQILGRPVAVTAYATAASQVRDGVDGAIVPLDNAGCAAGLAALIADPDRRERIAAYLRTHDYGNESEAMKIEKLL